MTKRVRAENDSTLSAELGDLIPALNRFAQLLYRDDELAADLTQETLAKAWNARGTFAPGTNLKGWLFAIMHNQFRSEARRSWRHVPWDQRAAETVPTAPCQQFWSVELDHVVRAINALPISQRDALILVGVGGFSSQDAAAMLGCRPNAARNRVSRARLAVRGALEGTRQIKSVQRHHGAPIADMIDRMQRLSSRPAERANAVAT